MYNYPAAFSSHNQMKTSRLCLNFGVCCLFSPIFISLKLHIWPFYISKLKLSTLKVSYLCFSTKHFKSGMTACCSSRLSF